MKTRIFTLIVSLFIATMTCSSKFFMNVTIGNISYDLNDDKTATLVEFLGEGQNTKLTVPSTVTYNNSKYVVTKIEDKAFYCDNFKEIILPNTIKSIGERAFANMYYLESINIPTNLNSIGNSAFIYCSSLSSDIIIPLSVKSIGESAFKGCTALKYITFYTDDIEIGNDIFDNTTNILFYQNGCCYTLHNDSNTASIKAEDKTLEQIIIPTTIKFGEYNSYLITKIDDEAFYGCSSLTSIEIPNSVTSIGRSAFDGINLTSINIPINIYEIKDLAFFGTFDTVVWNAKNYKNYTLETAPFRRSSITTFIFGDEVENIPNCLCAYLTSLKTVKFGKNIESIGRMLFWDSNLDTIIWDIPEYTTTMPELFYYTNSINPSEVSINEKIDTFILGNNVKTINKTLIRELQTLSIADSQEIFIPNSVLNIEPCDWLSKFSLSVNENNPNYTIIDEVLYNKDMTHLISCHRTKTDIEIPNSVTSIGDYAFSGCLSLTSITIPNSVTSIGNYAFRSCSSLTSITIPNSVTTIGYATFSSCSSLTSITIPNSVTSIGSYAFSYCSKLTSVIIGKNVKHIGVSAFEDCTSLTSITMKPKIAPSLDYSSFPYNTNTRLYIYYPCGYFDSYSHYYEYIFSYMNVEITSKSPDLDLFIARKDSIIISKQEYKYTFNEQKFTKNETVNLQGINWTLKTDAGDFGFDGNNTNSLERGQQIGSAKKPASYITLKTENIADKITKIKVNTSGANSINATFSISVNGIKYLPTSVNLTNAATEYEFSGAESGEITLNWTNNSSKAIYIKSIQITSEKSKCFIENNETSQQGIINILQKNDCNNNIAKIEAVGHWGYKFKQWNDGNTENPREIVVEDDTTIIAEFEPCAIYKVQLNCDEKLGSVFGAGKYNETTKTEISAIAKENYHFTQWSDGNTENPRTITITEDINLTAEFAIDQYQVTLKSNGNGSVTGSGTYDYGTKVTIEAIADKGYHFEKWSDGNTENPRKITVTEDMTLTAEFAKEEVEVDIENILITSANVYSSNGRLHVEGAETDYYVLDMAGRLIYSGRDTELQLPRGVYVVNVGGEVQKVVL